MTRGFSLVELLVATAIFSIVALGLLSTLAFLLQESSRAIDKTAGLYLLDEGSDAVRFLRDQGFDANIATLSLGTTYYLATSSTSGWEATTTPTQILSGYDLTFTLESVYRRTADSDIVSSSSPDVKAIDTNARKVTLISSWTDGRTNSTSTVSSVTYLTRLFD